MRRMEGCCVRDVRAAGAPADIQSIHFMWKPPSTSMAEPVV